MTVQITGLLSTTHPVLGSMTSEPIVGTHPALLVLITILGYIFSVLLVNAHYAMREISPLELYLEEDEFLLE